MGVAKLAQAKKKATAKAVKPKSSGVRKSPESGSAGRKKGNSAARSSVASKKPTSKKAPGNQSPAKKASKKTATVKKAVSKKPVSKKSVSKKPASKKSVSKKPASKKSVSKKPVSKKTNAKKDSAVTSRKMPADKAIIAKTTGKPELIQKVRGKARVDRTSLVAKAVVQQKPASRKADPKGHESNASNDSPESGKTEPRAAKTSLRGSDMKAGSGNQPESGMPAKATTRKQAAGLSHSSSQVQGKPAQKKRGWRDIEALTERARLKSLLSDIWHEDIDLDSDIFGERDSLFGYYTDKEEVIEVEPEDDEEWEEFEEEES